MAYPNPNPNPNPYLAQPYPSASAPIPAAPTTVIGPQFCAPYPVDLAVVKKVMSISDGNFVVTDVNGNVVFKVKGSLMTLRDRRVLVDAAGNPIVTLRRKIMTAHDRWQAFRGASTENRDLIFTLKRSSLIQFKTKLDVFLANNIKEDVCDFKVKGSWLERSCIVYAGESNNIVAQKGRLKDVLIWKRRNKAGARFRGKKGCIKKRGAAESNEATNDLVEEGVYQEDRESVDSNEGALVSGLERSMKAHSHCSPHAVDALLTSTQRRRRRRADSSRCARGAGIRWVGGGVQVSEES